MSELFDTIEMKALDAAERERIAYEEKLQARKNAAKAKRREAHRALLVRLAIAALLVLALRLAVGFELMAENLVLWLYAGIAAWVSAWWGAWVQFMWCKGGLLKW